LALAETRREVIADLRAQLASSEEQRARLQADAEKRIQELETALEDARREAREQAYQVERLYAIGSLTYCSRSNDWATSWQPVNR
jgi:fructoselysine-6-P-deglycase FrlB-like protein